MKTLALLFGLAALSLALYSLYNALTAAKQSAKETMVAALAWAFGSGIVAAIGLSYGLGFL